MSEDLIDALLEIRKRIEESEKHSGVWPDPWQVDLEELIAKTTVPKKPGKKEWRMLNTRSKKQYVII